MAELNIPITKAKASITVDTDALSAEVYAMALAEGLKVLLNKGMTKTGYATTGLEGPALVEVQTACLAKANENLADLMAGKTKPTKVVGAKKIPAAILVEARRLAKDVVRNTIRAGGGRISHYAAKDIITAANAMIEDDPQYIEKAAANLESRAAIRPTIDLSAQLVESPKLVLAAERAAAAKAAKAAAKPAKILSAAKAGRVTKRRPAAHA